MRTYLECIPCFVRQSLEAVQMVTDGESLQEEVMRGVISILGEINFEDCPPRTATKIHRLIRAVTGNVDPYKELKHKFNRMAMDMYPEMKEKVKASKDRFESAVKMAIAGNAIDCALVTDLDAARVQESVAETLGTPMDGDSVGSLKRAVEEAKRILYIGDNAGEIVFDRVLMEEMPKEVITFVVRGYPILNDATLEDAAFARVNDVVRVVDNGSDVPGTILEECSQDFRDLFYESDLVIAKGQGNFETLNSNEKPAHFLFKAKCPVVSKHIGCEVGTPIVYRSNPERKGV